MDNEALEAIDKEFELLERSILGMATAHDPTLDARIDIITDTEELKAYLRITPPKPGGRMVTFEEAIDEVKKAGILSPDLSLIKNAIRRRLFNKNLLIATGIPPIPGNDAFILLKVKNGELVKAGQHLATKIGATSGVVGCSVKGKEIPTSMGKDVRFLVGENVKVSEDGMDAFALKDGVLLWDGKTICVKEIDTYFSDEEIEGLITRLKKEIHPLSLDARLNVRIEDDGAFLIITPPRRGGRVPGIGEIMEYLKKKGILVEDEAILRDALEKKRFNTPICVSRYIPPEKGKDGRIIQMVKEGKEVVAGQLLAIKERPGPGVPGRGIDGTRIEAPPGRDVDILIGEGVRISEDGLRVYATRGGIFHLDGERMEVVRIGEDEWVKDESGIEFEKAFQHDEGLLDGRVRLEINEDRTLAYIIIIPPRIGGREIDFEDVMEVVNRSGIVAPDQRAIRDALSSKRFNTPVLIAKGRQPTNGRDPRLVLKKKGGERVKKGELVAVKIEGVSGKPGVDVFGNKIPPSPIRDIELKGGVNLRLSEDGSSLYAEVDGTLYWDGDRLCLEEGIELDSDIPSILDEIESEIEGLSESIKGLARGESNLDGRVEIEFREDEAEAYLIITPPMIGGRAVRERDVYSYLKELKIKDFDEDLIKRMIHDHIFNKPLLVAKGIPATQGRDAYCLYRYGVEGEERVIPGQLLMVKVPPRPGSQGISVRGKKIPPRLGNDIRLFLGRGVQVSEDGKRVYAMREGVVSWEKDLLSVEEVYDVDGDVDSDIEFDGRIRISGGVGPGISISSTSSIKIRGDVKGATIRAGGDLSVGGYLYDSKVSTRGDLYAKGIKGGEVSSGGLVVVEQEIIGAKVKTDRFLICRDGKGEVSGRIVSKGGIDARVIGSQKGTSIFTEEDGKVKAGVCIHPGVELMIGQSKLLIKRKKERVTIILRGGKITEEPYEPEMVSPTIIVEKIEQSGGLKDLRPSVVLISSSPEEAEKKGAELLGIEGKRVRSQVIEKHSDWIKVRVFKEEDEEFFRGLLEEAKPDEKRDGYYRISNTENGLFLTVFPPFQGGRPVEIDEVLEEIKRNGYKGVSNDEIRRALSEATTFPIRIGPRQFIPDLDGYIIVEVKDDGRAAYMTIVPPKSGGVGVGFEEAMRSLYDHGVVCGVKEDVVKDAITSKRFNIPILVATEIPPESGKGSEIEYKFNIEQMVRLIPDKDGRIDFKELGLIQNVKAGDLLAIKRIATSGGKPGRKVTGELIPPPSGPDIKLPQGKNTVLSEDGLELRAEIDGQVLFSGGRIIVEPIFEVKGNVDLSTGNIDFVGTVDIFGDVEDGFRVHANRDIQVRGSVGKAFLEAEGSIAILGGIQGGGEGEIFSGGDLICKFVEGAHLYVKGRVIVQQTILHSFVDTEDCLEVTGGRGCIIGGCIRVTNTILAKVIGCETGTQTILELGVSPKVRQQLLNLDGIYREMCREIEGLRLNINAIKAKGIPGKEDLLDGLIKRHDELTKKIQSYKERKRFLEEEILRSKTGSVIVLDTVYPGVRITIRGATFPVEEVMKGVVFTFEDNRVKVSPYKR